MLTKRVPTMTDGRRAKGVVVGLLSCFGIAMYAYLWATLYYDDSSCANAVWGGHGSSSARALTPITLFTYVAVSMVGIIKGINYRSKNSVDLYDNSKAYARVFNIVFILATALGVFLSGYLITVLGSPAARQAFRLAHPTCTTQPWKLYWWIPWSAVSAFAAVAIVAHTFIRETGAAESHDYVPWQRSSQEKLTQGQKVMIAFTSLFTFAAIALFFIAVAIHRHGLSPTKDSTTTMCDCSGLSGASATQCHDARTALWNNAVSSGGGVWISVAAGSIISTFVIIMFVSWGLDATEWGRRKWFVEPSTRYLSIVLSAVALVAVGASTGALIGAPTHELSAMCCPSGQCVSIKTYTTGVLILIGSLCWCVSLLTGHLIRKRSPPESLQSPASDRLVSYSLVRNALSSTRLKFI